jgi:hypothetical protein
MEKWRKVGREGEEPVLFAYSPTGLIYLRGEGATFLIYVRECVIHTDTKEENNKGRTMNEGSPDGREEGRKIK